MLSSSGNHSKNFVGRTGTAVMRLNSRGKATWVLLFSSSLSGNEEGLYLEGELQWHS